MVFDSPSADARAASAGPVAPQKSSLEATTPPRPPGVKFRIRFRKAGDLRLVSHHDLMHCFERMLRRADLPVLHTQGFNPHPRITFALSLALGVVGGAEVVELELADGLSANEVHERLADQAPPGLEILSVRLVDRKAKLQVRRALYRVTVPAEQRVDLAGRIADLLGAGECWVERTRPERRRLDVRPFISELRLDGDTIEMALWITSHGAARPEEILELLGLGELFAAGALILERTTLELMDEVPPGAEAPPAALPQGPRRAEPTEQTKDTGLSKEASKAATGRAAESAPRPTALISNPLEFDS